MWRAQDFVRSNIIEGVSKGGQAFPFPLLYIKIIGVKVWTLLVCNNQLRLDKSFKILYANNCENKIINFEDKYDLKCNVL